MANQTLAGMAGVTKDAWTSQTIQKQFYNKNPFLEAVKQVQGTMIGLQAQVPIQTTRNGGYTSVGPGGGSLNPAVAQGTAQALYTLVYHYGQVGLETAVLNQTASNAQAIIAGKDLEMQGIIDDMNRQISRQLVGNGDGLIAQCGTTTASNVVVLQSAANGGLGPDAIVRGHLHIGQIVDIGTTGDSDSLATGVSITDVDEVAGTITISGSAITTTTSHYVSVADPNSATAPNVELNGLRNIAGSTTASIGGINPASAGNSYWKPALVDTTTTAFSIDMALNLQRPVFQKSGEYSGHVFTSAKQQQNFYSLLQNQVRWTGENGMGAGGVGGLLGMEWNGQKISVLPDIYDKEWYYVTLSDLVRITGAWTEPKWMSDVEGSGGDVRWVQGTTSLVDAIVYAFQFGCQRRNTMSSATNLVA